jgi:cytochrome c556
MKKAHTVLALAALLTASSAAWADDQDVIDYRRHVMKTMGEQMKAMGMILEKKVPADQLLIHLKVIAATVPQVKSAFEPEVEGGEAKPEVWSNWDDFSKRLDILAAGTAELIKAAETGGAAAAASKLPTSLNCKGCHDVYRDAAK